MNEDKLLQELKKSAEQVAVPEALRPEQIAAMLERKQKEAQEQKKTQRQQDSKEQTGKQAQSAKQPEQGGFKRRFHFVRADRRMAAALVLLFCGSILFATAKLYPDKTDTAELVGESHAEDGTADFGETSPETTDGKQLLASLGDSYTLAQNYAEVYDVLAKSQEGSDMMTGDLAIMEDMEAGEETSGTSDGTIYVTPDSGTSGMKDEMSDSDSNKEKGQENQQLQDEDYSKTNVVTEGVDESDIVKTDGDYIYTIRGSKVIITSIIDNALTVTSSFTPKSMKASDKILEMYVDGDRLILLLSGTDTSLNSSQQSTDTEDVAISQSTKASEDVYYVDSSSFTRVLTYDISNREKAKFLGSVEQDGSYNSSRKIGDYVYLFTQKWLNCPSVDRKTAVAEDSLTGWIPLAGGEVIPADCIYLPTEGNNSMIMTSVNIVKNPSKLLDSVMVVNDNSRLYVSTDAVYLYEADYSNSPLTRITKFELTEDGYIHAVNATSVTGEVTDTFAINAYHGYLRILTTDWSGQEQSNQLYVLDENLDLTGSIERIAPGEQIYSARFLGNTGNFVTYRNTDPLFTVDLSDVSKPTIIGELEVTGFSEYLHFWGDDKLLGIGYETNPNNGTIEGVKLSMFDIRDPSNVTEEAKYVIKDADYSEAMDYYKSVLVSENKNLIGFAVENYDSVGNFDEGVKTTYKAFSYGENGFTNILNEDIAERNAMGTFRSLYANQILYLVDGGGIASYDMNNGYTWLKNQE